MQGRNQRKIHNKYSEERKKNKKSFKIDLIQPVVVDQSMFQSE